MRYVWLGMFLLNPLWALEFYAKLEPRLSYTVQSSIEGMVTFVDRSLEYGSADNSLVIELDHDMDQVELEAVNDKLQFTDSMINIEKRNHQRLKQVKTKSDFDKDAQRLKILTLQSTYRDLEFQRYRLKDRLKKKRVVQDSGYIQAIHVKKGNYVQPGSDLYDVKDLSSGKLELYIPIKQMDSIKNKRIVLDGVATDLSFHTIDRVAHEQYISSYKVTILVPNVKTFSALVKVEFQ